MLGGDESVSDIHGILNEILGRLDEHGEMLRDLRYYKVDDLEYRFKRHEGAHKLSEEDRRPLSGAVTSSWRNSGRDKPNREI